MSDTSNTDVDSPDDDDTPQSDFLGDLLASIKEFASRLLVSNSADEMTTAETNLANAITNVGSHDNLLPLVPAFVSASANNRPDDVALYDYACILAAICWRETRAGYGVGYRPTGGAGTGDSASRWMVSPPQWATDLALISGNTRVNSKGTTTYEVLAPAFAGASAKGWGYGLMQVDFASHMDWLSANDWTSPDINIDQGAAIFTNSYEQCDTLLAAVCGYNAGPSRANRASNPDSVTTGGNYGSDVLSTALSFGMSDSLWQPGQV